MGGDGATVGPLEKAALTTRKVAISRNKGQRARPIKSPREDQGRLGLPSCHWPLAIGHSLHPQNTSKSNRKSVRKRAENFLPVFCFEIGSHIAQASLQ